MSSFNFKEALSDVSHKTKSGVSTLRTKAQHTPASTKNATASMSLLIFHTSDGRPQVSTWGLAEDCWGYLIEF